MRIWVCNKCHAEIKENEKPRSCPLCGDSEKGFFEEERPDPSDEDKKYTKLVEEALGELESYDEGCDPESLKYSFEN